MAFKDFRGRRVTVRRPTIERGISQPFSTPDFDEKCGQYMLPCPEIYQQCLEMKS